MLTELIRQRFVVRVPEAPGPQPAVDISTQLNAARKAKPGAGGDEDEDDGVGMRSGLSNLSEGYREAKPKVIILFLLSQQCAGRVLISQNPIALSAEAKVEGRPKRPAAQTAKR
jgi:hypothetical protein